MKWIFAMLFFCASANADVLIVGDSVSQGYSPFLSFPATHNSDCPYFSDRTTIPVGDMGNAGNSKRAAACISLWLSQGAFDTVYFNTGLHDVHVSGCMKGGTKHQVELSDYLMNLQTVIDAIRAYGATPVFITTTPIQGRVDCHYNGDIKRYNAAAVAMMESQGIKVIDLYSAIFPIQSDYHLPSNIHFTRAGYKFLALVINQSSV